MSSTSHSGDRGSRSLAHLHIQRDVPTWGMRPGFLTEHLGHRVLVTDPCYSQHPSSHGQPMNLKTLDQSPKLRKQAKSREAGRAREEGGPRPPQNGESSLAPATDNFLLQTRIRKTI